MSASYNIVQLGVRTGSLITGPHAVVLAGSSGLLTGRIGHDAGMPANIFDRWLAPARQVARVAKGSGL